LRATKLCGVAAIFWMVLNGAALAEEPAPPEPEGFRLENYHAPTPATLKGATVIDTDRAYKLWSEKAAVFIDALSRPPRPADLPKEAEWSPPPRRDIPGSLWLPGVGLGQLSPQMQDYLEKGLERATGSNKEKPVVFYCRTHCWASWNTGKRALALGYKNILWYPGGADAWEKAGHPLEERSPEPMDGAR
jgi:PQQ-dependent catabolism-associated CXXCW motif protein